MRRALAAAALAALLVPLAACGSQQAAENMVNDALGGKFFATAQFEAEFPLGLPEEYGIRGGVFYDVGNLWDLSDVNLNGATVSGEGVRYTYGT